MMGPVGTQPLPMCFSVIVDAIFLFLLPWSFFPAPAEAPESFCHVLDFLRDFFWSDRDCDGNRHPPSCRGPALGLQGRPGPPPVLGLLFLLFLSFPTLPFPTLQLSFSFFSLLPSFLLSLPSQRATNEEGPRQCHPGVEGEFGSVCLTQRTPQAQRNVAEWPDPKPFQEKLETWFLH